MADNEVGTGYVVIKPKMEEGAISNLEAKGKAGGAGFGGAFQVAAGNLIANAVQSIASAAVGVFQDAFGNYANYEQLVGGVETLFKESAGIVQQNAQDAYRTAGMSANEYMEQVTSFSASLLQGLGGDTVAAANYADMAMRDMSDNANKMGTDMESITNAYQGFAKQNYTMLDNLKLGYGGTKTEMERLLKDASEIAGVEFNIDNYNDVIEAIHVMQEQMGIAGTTTVEGAATISGSVGKMKAAWQNFLTGVFDESADLGDLAERLFDSLGDVFANVVPRVGVLVSRMFTELPQGIIYALSSIPSILAPTIMAVFGEQMGGQIDDAISGAFEGITAVLEGAFAAIAPIFETVISFITENLFPVIGDILTTVGEVLGGVMETVSAIMPVVQGIVEDAMAGIKGVIDVVWPYVQGVIQGVMTGIRAFMDNVWPHISNVIVGAMNVIRGIISAVWPVVKGIVETAMNAISGIVETAWPVIQGVVENVSNAIEAVTQAVWPAIQGIVEGATSAIDGAIHGFDSLASFVQGVFDGIKSAIEGPMEAAKNFVGGIIDTIKGFFNFNISWPHIPLPHINYSLIEVPLLGSIPDPTSLSVDWYAKGGIVDGATLIGAGEAGPEMILPRRGDLMDEFAARVAGRSDDVLIKWLDRNLGPIIHEYAPSLTRRDFDRLSRGAV